ncbi:very-long-chain (3R)-3-hydroxyacyl-CoA dehydratase 4 isoform X1 [Electrophorus electricus]|uniref:Very-long-chain (3R)-3-hydroxyacyl-CoA dehydratase n=2 Tax=Electrophorus electricus TaxID=8005 RepID=A0AAY5ETT4_ELEEL|nr:very-long-chain (3R)-3-hydroxyacyl-CoA dehydratase 4 isoform X1 [Electrophorus electricus]
MFSTGKYNNQHHNRHGEEEIRSRIGLAYLFLYYLLQFCGHTWIFANMSARFLSFGSDALAGTFYFVGVMMSLCQLLSILELFHIADGLENCRLLPRFVQVMERNLILFLIINQEEFQSRTIVCVLFFLWNVSGLLRYPCELLRLISTPAPSLLWARYTLSVPVYGLSVIAEGISVLQALPYYESQGNSSEQLHVPVSVYVHFPYLLMAYLPFLALGAGITFRILLQERRQSLVSMNKKTKRE